MKVYAIRWGGFMNGSHMPLFLTKEKAEAKRQAIAEHHKKAIKEADEEKEKLGLSYKTRDMSDTIEIIELDVEE